jgi:biotin carboxyl carrier protein
MTKYIATIDEKEFLVEILDETHVSVDGVVYAIDFLPISDQPVYSILVNGSSYEGYVYQEEQLLQVLLRGTFYPALIEDEREKRLRATAGGNVVLTGDTPIKSPMPGLVIAVIVTEGQLVSKGDTLVILESMKMQNELRSPRDGVVSRLRVEAGQSVERHQILCYVGSHK